MFIPIRCFTCNTILADKYTKLQELNKQEKSRLEIFKELNLKKYCCRNIIVNHITITDIIKNIN